MDGRLGGKPLVVVSGAHGDRPRRTARLGGNCFRNCVGGCYSSYCGGADPQKITTIAIHGACSSAAVYFLLVASQGSAFAHRPNSVADARRHIFCNPEPTFFISTAVSSALARYFGQLFVTHCSSAFPPLGELHAPGVLRENPVRDGGGDTGSINWKPLPQQRRSFESAIYVRRKDPCCARNSVSSLHLGYAEPLSLSQFWHPSDALVFSHKLQLVTCSAVQWTQAVPSLQTQP